MERQVPRGGGNSLKSSHNQGFSLIEAFNNLALWGEKKFVSELKRTYKFQRGVNNILDCHTNQTRILSKEYSFVAGDYVRSTARNDVKRHTEDNSPKYRMVDEILSILRFFMQTRITTHHSLKRPGATHVALCDSVGSYFRHWCGAFTLAEVLITLGIIGVVAAMTMPALIQNYRNQVVETRLKKFYSTMNQAIAMSIKDNGDVETWTYFNDDQKDEDGNYINRVDDNDRSFNNYLAQYLKIIDKKDVVDGYSGQKRKLYFFEDGSAFAFVGHENRDITFFPKNAEKCITQKENPLGYCAFMFEFYPISDERHWKYLHEKGVEPFLFNWDGTVDMLYSDVGYGCKAAYPAYCTAIIQRNGWKVPKDYPKRIAF